MLMSILCTILSAVGIYGYFIDNNILFVLGITAIIIELLFGIITNKLKSITPFIISSVIGIICCRNLWVGIGIGLCFGSVIMFLLGIILLAIELFFQKQPKRE